MRTACSWSGCAKAVVAAGGGEPRVDVAVQLCDGGSVEVLVVDQQDVVVRVPAVLVTPGELQRDDVPGDPELALEPLPGGALGDVLPRIPLRIDKLGQRVVQVVRDGDRDQARCVPLRLPGGEGVAEFGGAAVVDLGGADGAQPHVAAGLQAAVVRGAVLDPDLDLVADGDGAAVALPLRSVGVGGREGPQVHPRSAAPSGGIVAGHQGVVRNFASIPRQCVRGSASRRRCGEG